MNVLRRREIIELWEKNAQFLDRFCCPDCRELLLEVGNGDLECRNSTCLNASIYDMNGQEIFEQDDSRVDNGR